MGSLVAVWWLSCFLACGIFPDQRLNSVPGGASGKQSSCQCRRHKRRKFNPWVRWSPGEGNDNPLQCPCLENPLDRGAWRAAAHGAAMSWRLLRNRALQGHQGSPKIFFFNGSFLKSCPDLLQYGFCFMFWFFGHEACGISASWPEVELAPPALECEVWTTGLPGKSH